MRFAPLFALLLSALCLAEVPKLETKTYDVRDLIIDIPDFGGPPVEDLRYTGATTRPATTRPADGSDGRGLFGGGDGGGGLLGRKDGAEPENSRQQLVETLKRSVAALIAGPEGVAVDQLNGQLIVTAPPAQHERIARALAAARDARLKQIYVEARFITLSTKALQKLDSTVSAAADVAMLEHRDAVTLDERQAASLLKSVAADNASMLVGAPRITVWQGQRAYVMVTSQKSFVRDLKVVVPSGQQAYEPQVDVVQSGILFDVAASASPDNTSVAIDQRVQLAELIDLVQKPAPGTKPEDKAFVQEPNQRILELHRLITLRSGQYALMHVPAVPIEKAAPDQHTFMLTKATVIAPQEPKPFPRLSTKPAE